MMLANEFEPLFNYSGALVLITGVDSDGIWYLGPSCRKTGNIGCALRMTPGPAAEELAAKHGGQVVEVA